MDPPSSTPPPYVLRARGDHATFFSLALVEDLLRHARAVERESDVLSLSLPQSRESLRVLSRIQSEGRAEELWPTTHPRVALPRRRLSPLFLLRAGVLRALDLPVPGDGTDDASLALGRDVVSGAPSAPLRFRPAAQEELRHAALAEWCEDLVFFAAGRGFSPAQLRALLLAAMHLASAVAELDGDSEAAAERVCAAALAAVCIDQSCAIPRRVLERRAEERLVTAQVPDPQFVAAVEARLQRERGRKQQAALREQLAAAPLVTCSRREVLESAVAAEVAVGPYFSPHEAAHVLEYFAHTAVRHWRLMREVLAGTQPVSARDVLLVQCDVRPFCIPPLKGFLREDVQRMERERHALWVDGARALEDAFESIIAAPLREMTRTMQEMQQRWEAQLMQEETDNRRFALDGAQYVRVVRALELRLTPQLEYNNMASLHHSEKEDAQTQSKPAETTSTPPLQPSLAASKRKSVVRSAKSVKVNIEPLPTAATQVTPLETVFSLDAVERRVTKLEVAAQAAIEKSKEKPTKRR